RRRSAWRLRGGRRRRWGSRVARAGDRGALRGCGSSSRIERVSPMEASRRASGLGDCPRAGVPPGRHTGDIMKRLSIVSALTLLLGVGAGAEAQSQREADEARVFERADSNGDGRISKEEWRSRAEQRFHEQDLNGDGKVTSAEAEAFCERKIVQTFSKLDADGDGRIAEAEASTIFRQAFSACDEDGDGYVSREEYERKARDRNRCEDGGKLFQRADSNGDGVL